MHEGTAPDSDLAATLLKRLLSGGDRSTALAQAIGVVDAWLLTEETSVGYAEPAFLHLLYAVDDVADPLDEAVRMRLERVVDRNDIAPGYRAKSLLLLAQHLGRSGSIDRASAAAAEASELYRSKATEDTSYEPDLAGALMVHADLSAQAGRAPDALASALELLTIVRRQIREDPVTYAGNFSFGAHLAIWASGELGDLEDALVLAREAIDFFEDRNLAPSVTYLVGSAQAYLDLAAVLAETEQQKEGHLAADVALERLGSAARLEPRVAVRAARQIAQFARGRLHGDENQEAKLRFLSEAIRILEIGEGAEVEPTSPMQARELARVLVDRADMSFASGEHGHQRQDLDRALHLLRAQPDLEVDDRSVLTRALTILARVHQRNDAMADAVTSMTEALILGRDLISTAEHAEVAMQSAAWAVRLGNELYAAELFPQAAILAAEALELLDNFNVADLDDPLLPAMTASMRATALAHIHDPGQREAAADAVDRWRARYRAGVAGSKRGLVAALVDTASTFANEGELLRALEATEEAAALCDSSDFEADHEAASVHARALELLSNLRSEAGRPDAVTPAVKAHQILVRIGSSEEMGGALHTVANRLSEVGRLAEALDASSKSVASYYASYREGRTPATGLAMALNGLANRQSESGLRWEALITAEDALAFLRDTGPDDPDKVSLLALLCANLASRRAARDLVAEALVLAQEACDLSAGLDLAKTGHRTVRANALGALSMALMNANDGEAAVTAATEAVLVRRSLIDDLRGPELLALALERLAECHKLTGNPGAASAALIESLELPVGLRIRRQAVEMLSELTADNPTPELVTSGVDALGQLREIAIAETNVLGRSDRRLVQMYSAELTSRGAWFLAIQANDPDAAILWLDALLAMEAQLTAMLRETSAEELARTHPEIFGRLARLFRQRPEMVDPSAISFEREPIETVLSEIRAIDGYSNFLRPRSLDAMRAAYGNRSLVFILACSAGVAIIALTPGQPPAAEFAKIDAAQVMDLLAAAADGHSGAHMVARHQLSALVDLHLVPVLERYAQDEDVVVIPVGLVAWLPIQARCIRRGFSIELRPAPLELAHGRHGRAVGVVHSNGPGDLPVLAGAAEEATRVANVFGTRLLADPEATCSEVLALVKQSRVIHLACHGRFDVDPHDCGLALADDWLTVDRIADELWDNTVPEFVMLSACDVGRTEAVAPEQAVSLATVLWAHGVRCVLAALWPIGDKHARDFTLAFYEHWSTGITAGEAHALAVRGAPAPSTLTVDSFSLLGDTSLRWSA